jgi:acetyl-CoA C-acetyltransferase
MLTQAPATLYQGGVIRPVYLHGSAVSTTWRDASRSLTDLIFGCVQAALGDAGISAADLGAVVLAAHDLVDGRGLTSMVTSPAAAAYLKDETRLGDDGALAFVLGDARVRSGSVDTCLVAAWGRASEGPIDEIAHALFDPFTARPLALTEIAVSGMRAARCLGDYPGYGRWRGDAAARRSAAADRLDVPPADPSRVPAPAWPLLAGELPVWADMVAAVVLSSQPGPVRVAGVGMSTEPYDLGDRDLTGLTALRAASGQALAAAGVEVAGVGVLELDGLTLFDEALAAEAVGAAARGDGMHVLASSARVNADGGYAAGYCAPAMGLVRIARAADRLRADRLPADRPRADRLGDAGPARLALATGASVVAAQVQAAVVLEGA